MCRVECQNLGDNLLQAYRAANSALEEIPAYSDPQDFGRKQRLKEELGERAEEVAVAAFRLLSHEMGIGKVSLHSGSRRLSACCRLKLQFQLIRLYCGKVALDSGSRKTRYL